MFNDLIKTNSTLTFLISIYQSFIKKTKQKAKWNKQKAKATFFFVCRLEEWSADVPLLPKEVLVFLSTQLWHSALHMSGQDKNSTAPHPLLLIKFFIIICRSVPTEQIVNAIILFVIMEDVVPAQTVSISIKVNVVFCICRAKWSCGHKGQMINIIYLHSWQQIKRYFTAAKCVCL